MQPKGFGKKYFTLASIQAHTVHVTLARVTTKVLSQHLELSYEDHDDETLEDEEFLLVEHCLSPLTQGSHRLKTADTSYSSNAPPFLHVNSNHNNYTIKGLL